MCLSFSLTMSLVYAKRMVSVSCVKAAFRRYTAGTTLGGPLPPFPSQEQATHAAPLLGCGGTRGLALAPHPIAPTSCSLTTMERMLLALVLALVAPAATQREPASPPPAARPWPENEFVSKLLIVRSGQQPVKVVATPGLHSRMLVSRTAIMPTMER